MSKVIVLYKGEEITIQCNEDEKMKKFLKDKIKH